MNSRGSKHQKRYGCFQKNRKIIETAGKEFRPVPFMKQPFQPSINRWFLGSPLPAALTSTEKANRHPRDPFLLVHRILAPPTTLGLGMFWKRGVEGGP